MGSEESETSGFTSIPSEVGPIVFQAASTPDSGRKVKTECVPPPLHHFHSTPESSDTASKSQGSTPMKRSSTAPHKLEIHEPSEQPPETTDASSSSPSGGGNGACGGYPSDVDSSEVIEKNNSGDGGELDRHESSASLMGKIKYSRESHRVEFEIEGPISQTEASLAEKLAKMANDVTVDEKRQQPSNSDHKEQQKPPDKITPITFNKNTSK